jgi:hypothetical protein
MKTTCKCLEHLVDNGSRDSYIDFVREGIEGAAIVWLVRVAFDMVILFAMMATILPERRLAVYRLVLPLALVSAVFTVASFLSSMS